MNTAMSAPRFGPGTVHKFLLDMGNTYVDMPRGARILSLHGVGNNIVIMALATGTEPTEKRHFETHFTDMPVREAHALNLIGSVTVYNDSSRVYVFEISQKLHKKATNQNDNSFDY